MNNGNKDFSITHPSIDDAKNVVDLMVACDIAEYGEPDSDLGSLIDQWSDIELDQDAWLVHTPGKQLIGYASVHKNDQRFTFDLYTLPGLSLTNVVDCLLSCCEDRAREQLRAVSGEKVAIIYIAQTNKTNIGLVENLGYKPERYHFGMRIRLDKPPSPPIWPVHVDLRNFFPDVDNQILFDFIKIAFDRPGRIPFTYERWHNIMMCASNFNPELWFLAYHQEELIGTILCFEYPQHGWVRQLAVSTLWRGKGIGSALLLHCFKVFHQRGFTTVGLGVAADNPSAYKLYESVGMKCTRQYLEYCKAL